MKIAINSSHTNKMPAGLTGPETKAWWNKFNGDFRNFDIPAERLIQAIKRGYSYTTQHKHYRKASNFLAGQHIGLDFDTGDDRSAIDSLISTEFIRNCASFIHTTASHTNQAPRARVVFILPFPFRQMRKYSLVTQAFAHHFGHADTACSDPARIFFGATDCTVHWLGNVLDIEDVTRIVLHYKETREEQFVPLPTGRRLATGPIGPVWETMLSNLLSTPEGQRWSQLGRYSLAAGGYVAGGYMTFGQAYDDLFGAVASMNAMSAEEADNRIRWGLSTGGENPLFLQEDLEVDPLLANFL